MERGRLKERQIPRYCTDVFKNDDGTKYISNQMLYKASKTPGTDAVLARYAVKFFERSPLHLNSLVAECLVIEISEENLPHSKWFPQCLLSYKSDNRLFDWEDRAVLYTGRPIGSSIQTK